MHVLTEADFVSFFFLNSYNLINPFMDCLYNFQRSRVPVVCTCTEIEAPGYKSLAPMIPLSSAGLIPPLSLHNFLR